MSNPNRKIAIFVDGPETNYKRLFMLLLAARCIDEQKPTIWTPQGMWRSHHYQLLKKSGNSKGERIDEGFDGLIIGGDGANTRFEHTTSNVIVLDWHFVTNSRREHASDGLRLFKTWDHYGSYLLVDLPFVIVSRCEHANAILDNVYEPALVASGYKIIRVDSVPASMKDKGVFDNTNELISVCKEQVNLWVANYIMPVIALRELNEDSTDNVNQEKSMPNINQAVALAAKALLESKGKPDAFLVLSVNHLAEHLNESEIDLAMEELAIPEDRPFVLANWDNLINVLDENELLKSARLWNIGLIYIGESRKDFDRFVDANAWSKDLKDKIREKQRKALSVEARPIAIMSEINAISFIGVDSDSNKPSAQVVWGPYLQAGGLGLENPDGDREVLMEEVLDTKLDEFPYIVKFVMDNETIEEPVEASCVKTAIAKMEKHYNKELYVLEVVADGPAVVVEAPQEKPVAVADPIFGWFKAKGLDELHFGINANNFCKHLLSIATPIGEVANVDHWATGDICKPTTYTHKNLMILAVPDTNRPSDRVMTVVVWNNNKREEPPILVAVGVESVEDFAPSRYDDLNAVIITRTIMIGRKTLRFDNTLIGGVYGMDKVGPFYTRSLRRIIE